MKGSQPMKQWEKNLLAKHSLQMRSHESAFGKLGELQTKQQKAALKKANAQLEKAAS